MNKTPISILQELMVQRKAKLPEYIIEDCSGLSPNFKCTVKLDEVSASAFATTKKEAKQKSAQQALQIVGFVNPTDVSIPANSLVSVVDLNLSRPAAFINYVGKLNEFASTHNKPYPVYNENIVAQNGFFSTTCSFLNLCVAGQGLKKKDAKQEAARVMLEKIRTENLAEVFVKVENIMLDDRQNNNISNFDQEIRNKYEEIASMGTKNLVGNTKSILQVTTLQEDMSLDDFKKELNGRGYDYTIEQFQSKPCIMMMKIKNSPAVFMGSGATKEAALKDLVESTIKMLMHGFSLNVEFF